MSRIKNLTPEQYLLKISVNRLLVLTYLKVNGGTCFTTLAKLTNLSHSAITGQADELEAAGYVTTRRGVADRRRRYMVLTDKGADLLSLFSRKYAIANKPI